MPGHRSTKPAPSRGNPLQVARLLLWLIVLPAFTHGTSYCQPEPAGPLSWHLFIDGVAQPLPVHLPLDSLQSVVEGYLHQLGQEGYPLARVDSVVLDTAGRSNDVEIYFVRGDPVRVGGLHLAGTAVLDSLELLAGMETRPGRAFSPAQLEADVDWILGRYEAVGHLLAEIRVQQADLTPGPSPAVDVRLAVSEGPRVRLKRIEAPGAERTDPGYLSRIIGLQQGRPLTRFDAERIRERLLETGLFRSVEAPRLRIEPDSQAVLVIPLVEEPPGLFDLALGYQPPVGAGSGRLVGSGHLVLRNLLGGGRSLSLRLSRLPGRVSNVQGFFADPFVAGLPVGVEARFDGMQDSTLYGKQRYAASLTYRLPRDLEVVASLSRERTRPGQEGVKLDGGRQRIPRAQAWFAGLGLRYRRLDQPQNPGRGVAFDLLFERGAKDRQARHRTAAGDTTLERSRLQQDRFTGTARMFAPMWGRQVLVLGVDARLLGSDTYDPSDLFRFGGATTLRGYDEERFLGRLAARFLAEYRYRIDRLSYLFAFTDAGYVETPEAQDRVVRGVYPGFGFGIQYDTPVGLVNTSYAMNREDGTLSGRVHVGLSFGL